MNNHNDNELLSLIHDIQKFASTWTMQYPCHKLYHGAAHCIEKKAVELFGNTGRCLERVLFFGFCSFGLYVAHVRNLSYDCQLPIA